MTSVLCFLSCLSPTDFYKDGSFRALRFLIKKKQLLLRYSVTTHHIKIRTSFQSCPLCHWLVYYFIVLISVWNYLALLCVYFFLFSNDQSKTINSVKEGFCLSLGPRILPHMKDSLMNYLFLNELMNYWDRIDMLVDNLTFCHIQIIQWEIYRKPIR